MPAYVYILSNRREGTLYTGVTSNLEQRMLEHKQGKYPGFSKKYGLHLLVYYEAGEDMRLAIQREKNIKHYSRRWKIDMIERMNPEWEDLSAPWFNWKESY